MWRLDAVRAEKHANPGGGLLPTSADGVDGSLRASDADDDDVEPSDSHMQALKAEFWLSCEADSCWKVPMGRDLQVMPWLPNRSCGLLEAISRARNVHGRSPLLIDNTPDRVIDTFYLYRHVQVLEAKAMVMDERMGKKSRAQIMEAARRTLVNAMRYGQTLLIRMSNTAAPFTSRYNDDTTLPLAIFDHAVIDALRRRHSGPLGENLMGSDHPLAAALREADTEHGHFTARLGFEVVVSTQFAVAEYRDFLARALPLDRLQPILPQVAPRRPSGEGGGEGRGEGDVLGGEDGGDGDGEGEAEEEAPWGLKEAHAASIRMARRVEEMRARRTGAPLAVSTPSASAPPRRPAARRSGPPQPMMPAPSSSTELVAQDDEPQEQPLVHRCYASPAELLERQWTKHGASYPRKHLGPGRESHG